MAENSNCNNYGYIYKTTCLPTGKIYIGRHKSTKYDRWYLGSGSKIVAEIERYGEDNFTNELLCWCTSEEELNRKEREAILANDSRNPDIGYNISRGGTKGDWLNDLPCEKANEFRHKMSELSRLGICGNKGRHLSEKHKQRIGEGNKGKVRTAEWRHKQSAAQKGQTAWNKGLTIEDDRVKKYARKPGEFTHSLESRSKMSLAKLGRVCVTNGQGYKMVKAEEVDDYLRLGYRRGKK